MKKFISASICLTLTMSVLSGCSSSGDIEGKTTIELVTYKMEAVDLFNEFAREFNDENPDLNLVIEAPKDATTVIKTRLIKDDAPDIIGIGGDSTFSMFVDTGVLGDISDYQGLGDIKESYLEMDKKLEPVPKTGVYALPYVANASGILFNEKIFAQNGWDIPDTWDGLIDLCEKIQAAGLDPFTLGYKDSWTTLAPWNALAVSMTSPDLFTQVSQGLDKFSNHYGDIALKQKELLKYSGNDPFAYGYNDACTAFARGMAAMYPIGSYAIPQILSVNPDLEIGSFVLPANNDPAANILNSGIDLQFSVMKDSKVKEECYRVLEFFQRDENIQKYINEQISVPCKQGEFELNGSLTHMKDYIDANLLSDYPDHHYPSEMGADALIQTYLITGDLKKFLDTFDKDWIRFNQDNIRKLSEYEQNHQ